MNNLPLRIVSFDGSIPAMLHYRRALEAAGFEFTQRCTSLEAFKFINFEAAAADWFFVNLFVPKYTFRGVPEKDEAIVGVFLIRKILEKFPEARIVILAGVDNPEARAEFADNIPFFCKMDLLPIEFAKRIQWLVQQTTPAAS